MGEAAITTNPGAHQPHQAAPAFVAYYSPSPDRQGRSGRLLRPLWRMLTADKPPEALRLPKRPRPPRRSAPARPEVTTPPWLNRRDLPPWLRRPPPSGETPPPEDWDWDGAGSPA